MKLIFLYGPVAAGKLTVARELAGITGFPLFHIACLAAMPAPQIVIDTETATPEAAARQIAAALARRLQ